MFLQLLDDSLVIGGTGVNQFFGKATDFADTRRLVHPLHICSKTRLCHYSATRHQLANDCDIYPSPLCQ
jgi:hypothetical protein